MQIKTISNSTAIKATKFLHLAFSFKPLCLILTIFTCQINLAVEQDKNILIDESFTSLKNWNEVKLNDATKGIFRLSNHSLEITNNSKKGFYGLYHTKPITGNFYAEAEFVDDDVIGLALIANKDGVPDVSNYTMIAVSNHSGITFINQYDRQKNIENVHDPKNIISPSRYEARLDSMTFSVPYRSTNKRIRILHESLSNTFHFYYGTKLEKWSITTNDWMEVAPQYSWLPADQQYFVALVCLVSDDLEPKTAVFKNLKVLNTPTDDLDDNNTGFKAVKRNFSWSGFEGDATVITFGKEFANDKNIKFVFWDRANNAPAWRLTNQFLLNFEFFESGDSVFPGCHEAMSDRQRHGQSVTIVEDNEVRKIIHWQGIPMNPNYNFTGEDHKGTLFPYYDEFWTFYPDGTGTREFIDIPNLDVEHRRSWGPEIIEIMPLGGSLVEAGDMCNSPALSVFSINDSVRTFLPQPTNNTYAKDSWKWPQIVYDAHFKNNLPDFFIVYSQDPAYPEIWPGINIETQISWHETTWNFSHWPVGREPYGQNAADWGKTSRSYASNKNEVTHTSLVSAGFYGKLGVDFSDHYLTDSTGRKYRRHVMLTGVSKPYNYDEVRNQIQTWLDPGTIRMISNHCELVKIDRIRRTIVFSQKDNATDCTFSIEPKRTIINPAITVENWKGNESVNVTINGEKQMIKTAMVGKDLLVWIQATLSKPVEISIGM